MNLYQYSGSDPIDYADPSGLSIFGELLEEAGEFVTGFGDTVSGGLTRDVREGLGLAEPDYSSGAYGAGSDSGIAVAFAIPGDEEVGAAEAADEFEATFDASTPVGRRGSPMDVPRGTNVGGRIDGTTYGGHALDEMQSEGFVPSVVEDAIEHGNTTVGASGRVGHYSADNNITVITEDGRVVTVSSGRLNIK